MIFTTIGTCRLAHPFTVASNDQFIRDQTNVYGYVHAAKEVSQQLDFIFGRQLPPEYAPMIAAADEFPVWRKRRSINLWIVEISSLKQVVLDGYYLQINHIARVFEDNKNFLTQFWEYPEENMRKQRSAALKNIDGYRDLDDLEKEFLERAFVTITSEEALAREMKDIFGRLEGKVVFVPHVNVPTKSGRYISARVSLLQYMRKIARIAGFSLFNPADYVERYGITRAMLNGGADLNHYSSEFIEVLGHTFRTTILDPYVRKKPLELIVNEGPESFSLLIDDSLREEEQLSAEHVAEDVKSIEVNVSRLIEMGRPEEAAQIVTKVIPEDRSPAMRQPLVRALQNKFKQLRMARDGLLALSVLDSWRRLGYADVKLAKAIASTAREVRNESRCLIQQGEFAKALALLESAHEIFPENSVILRDLALANERIDQRRAALLWAELYSFSHDEFDIKRALKFARRTKAWDIALQFLGVLAQAGPLDQESKELENFVVRSAVKEVNSLLNPEDAKRADNLRQALFRHDPRIPAILSFASDLTH